MAPASRRYALRMAFERWRRLGLLLTLTTPAALACGCSGSSKESAPDGGGSGGPDGSSSGVGDAMHGGDSPVTGDAGGGDAPGPTTPTVSSWVGTNVDADLPYADITHMLSAFNTAAAQLAANGYPVAGASGQSQTDLGFELPTGTYDISYVGAGTLAVSGIGALVDSWQTVNGEQRAQIKITGTPGSFGHSLTLGVTNGASQTVTNIHIYLPGIDYDATNPFNPAFLSALTPFRATRFMGWMQTNNSKLANWADRPASASFGASLYGVPYELIAELANQTGKDTWINIPEAATSSFITSFAAFMAQNLDFTRIAAARQAAGFTTPYQLILENSNETWNTGFSAYNTFLTAASSNPTRYPGTYAGSYGPSWMTSDTDLMKVGQYEADRLVTIAQAFQQALQAGGHADAVAPVLSGWALGAGYSDDGLAFIQKNYGTPSVLRDGGRHDDRIAVDALPRDGDEHHVDGLGDAGLRDALQAVRRRHRRLRKWTEPQRYDERDHQAPGAVRREDGADVPDVPVVLAAELRQCPLHALQPRRDARAAREHLPVRLLGLAAGRRREPDDVRAEPADAHRHRDGLVAARLLPQVCGARGARSAVGARDAPCWRSSTLRFAPGRPPRRRLERIGAFAGPRSGARPGCVRRIVPGVGCGPVPIERRPDVRVGPALGAGHGERERSGERAR